MWQFIRRYAAHDDPRVAAANLVALVVASNQPFYPLYLLWTVGTIGSSFLTFLSTAFFLSVPALARVNPLLGRALLPVTGIANTVLCTKLFGEASGVETFLIPCAVLATGLFGPKERLFSLVLAGLAALAFLGLHGHYGVPVDSFTPDQQASLLKLNAASAGGLAVFIGIVLAGIPAPDGSRGA